MECTKKQKWYLHVLTGVNTSNLKVSKKECSRLITLSKIDRKEAIRQTKTAVRESESIAIVSRWNISKLWQEFSQANAIQIEQEEFVFELREYYKENLASRKPRINLENLSYTELLKKCFYQAMKIEFWGKLLETIRQPLHFPDGFNWFFLNEQEFQEIHNEYEHMENEKELTEILTNVKNLIANNNKDSAINIIDNLVNGIDGAPF